MEPLTTADGLALHLRHWPLREPHGRVLVIHGLGEHVGRYEDVARAVNAAGWAVSGYDQRGHGRSGGERGAIAEPDSLCHDLARVIDRVRDDRPLVLLGHSMGGLVAARFAAEALAAQPAAWSRPLAGLVLSSPALDAGLSKAQKLLLALAAPLTPTQPMSNGLDPRWISRVSTVVLAYERDPLVHDRITPRLVRFIVDGGRLVRRRAAEWKLPTLLMWAGADRCVAPRGSAAFAAAAPRDIVQAEEFPGLSHEIFNEPEREQVLARLMAFLARF